MKYLLGLIVLFIFLFFTINSKESFVQTYNYPLPLDPTKNNMYARMMNPGDGITRTQEVVTQDLIYFNNASNLMYGNQRIPLPNLPLKYV